MRYNPFPNPGAHAGDSYFFSLPAPEISGLYTDSFERLRGFVREYVIHDICIQP